MLNVFVLLQRPLALTNFIFNIYKSLLNRKMESPAKFMSNKNSTTHNSAVLYFGQNHMFMNAGIFQSLHALEYYGEALTPWSGGKDHCSCHL